MVEQWTEHQGSVYLNLQHYSVSDTIEVLNKLQAEVERLKTGHCRDCCCAQSWVALGITEMTGLSISEEIEKLKAENERLEAEVEHYKTQFRVTDEMLSDHVDRIRLAADRGADEAYEQEGE